MADTWITKMSHFDYRDDEADELPRVATRLAEYLGSILRETIYRLPEMPPSTGLRCRRRPGHVRCYGHIQSELLAKDTEVRWWCSQCGDNGYISDWEGTRWEPGKPGGMPRISHATLLEKASNPAPPIESEVSALHENIEGMINYDADTEGAVPKIMTATKEYTWEEIGKHLMTYEGFRICLMVRDDSK